MTKLALTSTTRRGTIAKRFEYPLLQLQRIWRRLVVSTLPIDSKVIIFDAFNGRSYNCSPKAIYESLLADRRFNDCTFIWVFQQPEHYKHLKSARTRLVKYGSKEYYEAYAHAGTWIVNAKIPLEIPKRRGQTLVQCSHGTPFKRLRADVVKGTENAIDSYKDMLRKSRIDTLRYDYFVTPSQFTSRCFSSAFQLKELGKEDIILEVGYPRNDRLHSYTESETTEIKQNLNIPLNKKVLLYAPTWRDDQFENGTGFVYEPPFDIAYLREQLGDEYVILFRAHYLIAKTFDFSGYKGFMYNVSDIDDVNDLYIISDVLVTDYSSVFFDYANLRRPMLFYMYDKEHYQKDLRGFYLPLEAVPGDIVTTQRQLVDKLQDLNAYAKRTAKTVEQFSKEYNYLDDGHAAERVIERVFTSRME